MWMGARPMLALGNIEWAGAKDILSHGRIKETQLGRRKLCLNIKHHALMRAHANNKRLLDAELSGTQTH